MTSAYTIPTQELPAVFSGHPLFQDYTQQFSKVSEFYATAPSMDSMVQHMQSRNFSAEKRDQLVSLLLHSSTRETINPKQLKAIASLRDPKTFAVITGQQSGLLGGPLFTMYKAMHAIRLARKITEQTDFNAVPIFWVASEDHDLAEIDHFDYVSSDNALHRLRVPYGPTGFAAEFATVQSDPAEVIDHLKQAFPENNFRDNILQRCTMMLSMTAASSFRFMLHQLFKDTPLIQVDPFVIRPLGGEIIEREILEPGRNAERVREQGAALQQAGYDMPVTLSGQSNLFLLEDNVRKRLDWNGSIYTVNKSDATYTPEDLLTLWRGNPLQFSCNVALRTVVQEHSIPSAGVVLGAGEVAYYGQFKSLFASYDLQPPVLIPRANLTVVEARVARKLKKHNLDMRCLTRLEGLPAALATIQEGSPAMRARALQNDIQQQLQGLQGLMEEANAAMHKWTGKATRKISSGIDKLVTRIHEESDASQASIKDDVALFAAYLFPNGKPQERAMNVVQFLLRYGWGWVDSVMDIMDIETRDHQVIEL